eukprot:3785530-Prorocentrum_lima.AAC.1
MPLLGSLDASTQQGLVMVICMHSAGPLRSMCPPACMRPNTCSGCSWCSMWAPPLAVPWCLIVSS